MVLREDWDVLAVSQWMLLFFYTKEKQPKENLRLRLFAMNVSAIILACTTRKTLMPRKELLLR